MANMSAAEYTKTYSTFGGCDIVPTFNGKVIGEIQAITYSLTREKVPVYKFLKEPLIRKFGEEWYAELEEAAEAFYDSDYYRDMKK